jgi:hypothetical protein
MACSGPESANLSSTACRIDAVVARPLKPSVMRLPILVTMRPLQILFTAIFVFSIGCNVQQDRMEAQKAAERIHSQLQSLDYASVYRESGESFKEVGDESKFIAGMRLLYEENGTLKTATPIAYQSGVDSNVGRTHTLIFNLEFERGRAKERMVLTRSTSGPMQLWDLRIDPIP